MHLFITLLKKHRSQEGTAYYLTIINAYIHLLGDAWKFPPPKTQQWWFYQIRNFFGLLISIVLAKMFVWVFPLRCYGKTWTDSLANPIHYYWQYRLHGFPVMGKLPHSALGSLLGTCTSGWGWEEWGTAKQGQSLWASERWRKQASLLRLEVCNRMGKKVVMKHNLSLLQMWRSEGQNVPFSPLFSLKPWNECYLIFPFKS